MKKFNLVLSGGGVRSYAHIGVYKYCFEAGIEFDEITCISGASLIAPFIALRKNPADIIELFKKEKISRKLFPFYFVPDKFECLFFQPSTYKLGVWLEKQFTPQELAMIETRSRDEGTSPLLHIMATRNPICGTKVLYTDMLKITDLKNAVAASCAISGIFKEHKVGDCTYIDGGHWNNCPLFFNFENSFLPVLGVNLGYVGLKDESKGRISKIIRGFEINFFARVQEDIEKWNFEKSCKKRGELIVVNPTVWNVGSLDFNLKEWQIDDMINAGYNAAKEKLAIKNPPTLSLRGSETTEAISQP